MKRAFTSAGILCCNILLVFGSVASAAEPAQSSIPILSKIPYVNRLFTKTTPALHCQEANETASSKFTPRQFRIVGTDGLERIGIDFDCQVVGAKGPCCEAVCAPAECKLIAAKCGNACAVECISEVTASESRLLMDREAFHEREVELLGELFEARLEAAVAQANLEARDETAAKESKLQKKLMAARLETAKFQAKLEFAEEKQKLAAELHQAQLELVALKASSGLAAAKLGRKPVSRSAAETLR